jgi:DNA-binding transcriptional MerR regulator
MGSIFDCRLGTDQAAYLAGATVRQLDYWCNRGLITPATPATGKGSAREFGFVDIVRIKVLVNLRQAGVPLQRIRKALKQLKEWNEKDPLTSGRLLAVEDQLFWIESDEVLVDILKQQRAMAQVVLLDLAEIDQETRVEMAALCAA